MAYPYKDYIDEEDLSDSDTDSDTDSDVGIIEDNAMRRAIQNSLETFQQDMDRPTAFTAEEIQEDERRRDRELYGPPTPRHQSPEIAAMNNQGLIPLDAVLASLKMADSDKAFLNKPFSMMVSEIVDAMVEYNKAGNIARPGDLLPPAHNGSTSGVGGRTCTSTSIYTGQGLDVMETPCHEVRVAIIKAALRDPNSHLAAEVRAQQTQNFNRRASFKPVSRATSGQVTHARHSGRAASQTASDEEQERSANEQLPRKRARFQ